jgi:hypothetical protein
MKTKLKHNGKAKHYPIEDLRSAVVGLQGVLDENYTTLSKAKRERIDESVVALVESYNQLRYTLAYKPSLAPWIPSPIPGQWPVSETDPTKPPERDYAKPLLGPNGEA